MQQYSSSTPGLREAGLPFWCQLHPPPPSSVKSYDYDNCCSLVKICACNAAQDVDLDQVERIFNASKAAAKVPHSAVIEPLREGDVKRVDGVLDGEEMRWIQLGFKLIAEARPRPCKKIFLGALSIPSPSRILVDQHWRETCGNSNPLLWLKSSS
jgi:hypothetical protein